MTSRTIVLLLAIATGATGCITEDVASNAEAETDETLIVAYQAQVSPQLRRGSQPDHKALVSLDRAGYRSIVNLRTENDSERPDVLNLGMDPHRIPVVDRQSPTMAQVIGFLDFATRSENQPVFVHCQAGQGRTGLFVAAYRMAVQNWSQDDAIAEAKRMGMTAQNQADFLEGFGHALRHDGVPHYRSTR